MPYIYALNKLLFTHDKEEKPTMSDIMDGT